MRDWKFIHNSNFLKETKQKKDNREHSEEKKKKHKAKSSHQTAIIHLRVITNGEKKVFSIIPVQNTDNKCTTTL